ncbi:hypothetical protein [Bacillus sp. FJAT-27445]|uniref:hypothetical protein n=1 Tax=Bacillus sp. FJAT-27445 TaxID=1679166 RepID=UPI000743B54C|nr:hypothetical protein [Bacillus sp. FJAT-27445]
MRLHSSNKQKWIPAALAILFIVFSAGAYFFTIQPLKADLEAKEASLKTEEQLLSIIQGRDEEAKEFTANSSTQMQYQIPVKPLVEQMILDFEKAEVVSRSKILSMSFAKDSDVAALEEEAAAEETISENGESSENAQTDEGQLDETAAPPKSVIKVPEGVKKVTVQLSVESPSYAELEKFIKTLESMKRITVVESIDYTGGAELTSLQEKDEPIKFSITVSAFYMPELKDLVQQLPDIGAPEPARKRDPLTTFGEEVSENETNEN